MRHQACKRTGAKLDVIPSDESGVLDLAALEEILMAGRVKVVAITHVPTNGGVINPAKEGTRLCYWYLSLSKQQYHANIENGTFV